MTTKDENGVPIVTDCSGVLSRAGGYFGPGHMKLKDLNGDGVIDADNDRKVIVMRCRNTLVVLVLMPVGKVSMLQRCSTGLMVMIF